MRRVRRPRRHTSGNYFALPSPLKGGLETRLAGVRRANLPELNRAR